MAFRCHPGIFCICSMDHVYGHAWRIHRCCWGSSARGCDKQETSQDGEERWTEDAVSIECHEVGQFIEQAQCLHHNVLVSFNIQGTRSQVDSTQGPPVLSYATSLQIQPLCLDPGRDLDNTSLAIFVWNAISPPNALVASSIASGGIDTDVLEHEIPSSLGYNLLCG